jgi:hypothetical protein
MAKSGQGGKSLSAAQCDKLLGVLKDRFGKNMGRHKGIVWATVLARLDDKADKLWTLAEMERTGGEPDVVEVDPLTAEVVFYDCSAESPAGRRSLCYDGAALSARKEFKPKSTAVDMAAAIGIELLTEVQYHALQELGHFDTKTSSWLKTPADIRGHGGAIFGDRRYGRVFVYHNGASSYYAARRFRGVLKV